MKWVVVVVVAMVRWGCSKILLIMMVWWDNKTCKYLEEVADKMTLLVRGILYTTSTNKLRSLTCELYCSSICLWDQCLLRFLTKFSQLSGSLWSMLYAMVDLHPPKKKIIMDFLSLHVNYPLQIMWTEMSYLY